jgi:hypothetical protein
MGSLYTQQIAHIALSTTECFSLIYSLVHYQLNHVHNALRYARLLLYDYAT